MYVFALRSHDSGNDMVEVLESGVSHDMVLHQERQHLGNDLRQWDLLPYTRAEHLFRRADELKQMKF